MDYMFFKVTAGAIATFALYSILFKENSFYRFFEHVFLGLAAGYSMVAIWQDTLYQNWWLKMVGQAQTPTADAVSGYWPYALLVPIGLMGYFVFSKKSNWLSRIPIGIILGLWSGQQITNWWRTFGPQILDSMKPIIPNAIGNNGRVPAQSVPAPDGSLTPLSAEQLAVIQNSVYPSQALSNLIFLVTLLSAMSYFIFSYEVKGKIIPRINWLGRIMLMMGFGAIFGNTVMARFALVIDRMAYVFIEWGQQNLLRVLSGG
jgi:hypothetical protein